MRPSEPELEARDGLIIEALSIEELVAELIYTGWKYARVTNGTGALVGEVYLDPKLKRRVWRPCEI